MSKAPPCVIWNREMEVRGIPTKESRESRELLKGSQGKRLPVAEPRESLERNACGAHL